MAVRTKLSLVPVAIALSLAPLRASAATTFQVLELGPCTPTQGSLYDTNAAGLRTIVDNQVGTRVLLSQSPMTWTSPTTATMTEAGSFTFSPGGMMTSNGPLSGTVTVTQTVYVTMDTTVAPPPGYDAVAYVSSAGSITAGSLEAGGSVSSSGTAVMHGTVYLRFDPQAGQLVPAKFDCAFYFSLN